MTDRHQTDAKGGAGRTGRRSGRPETRQEILDAARLLFAERGFAATSMRAVGTAASVDPALVHHYFGTKEGLFRAAIDPPVDIEELIRDSETDAGPDTAQRLVAAYLRVWDSPETGPAMVGFLRRAIGDPGSGDLLRNFLSTAVLRSAADHLLADANPAEAEERVALVISQLLGIAVLRNVLAVEPLASIPAGDLIAAIAPSISAYLAGVTTDIAAATATAGRKS